MGSTVYKPAEVAHRLGVHSNTVRLWCREFADFLSPTANPTAGQYRKFTADDLIVFERIADMHRQRVPLGTMRSILASMPPADLRAVTVDAETAVIAPTNAPAGADLPALLSTVMREEIALLRASLEGADTKAARAQATGFAQGFTAAILLILALLLGLGILVSLWNG